MVLRWIINPDLHLRRFVKHPVDRILLVASADAWSYVNISLKPADVGTRVESVKRSGSRSLGPDFLLQKGLEPQPSVSTVTRDVAAAPQTPQLGGAQANFGGPS